MASILLRVPDRATNPTARTSTLHERPELPVESVPGEQLRRGVCGGRFPIDVEAGPVPVRAEVIDCLRRHDRAACEPPDLEPPLQFVFRPEGGDVRSREPNIVPEAPGRHQEMDQRLAQHDPARHAEIDGLRGRG